MRRRPKKAHDGSDDDDDDSQPDENPEDPEAKPKDKEKDQWFDETQVTRASRTWKTSVVKTMEAATASKAMAAACNAEFEREPDKDNYKKELAILSSRLVAFDIVMNAEGAEESDARLQLNALKARYEAAADPGAGDGSSIASTDAILKAPPCLGFLDIGFASDLDTYEQEIAECRSVDAIKAVLTKAAASKKIVENLIAAVRGAAAETYSARTNLRRAAKDHAAAAEKRRAEMDAAQGARPSRRNGRRGRLPQAGAALSASTTTTGWRSRASRFMSSSGPSASR